MDAISDTTYGTKLHIKYDGQVLLPATTNGDMNAGGPASIITKGYLEDVFDLDGGVLTINLDPS